MSTLRVDNITDLGDDPVVTNGVITSVPGRNLLYNGAMQVAQRGTSSTGITAAGYYTADRWRGYIDPTGGLGTWTNSIESDGPTGSGFTKSWKWLCTTANSSLDAADLFFVGQRLEGQDLQALKKGTADAESLTLSFWVKSNVTGTYTAILRDYDNTRSISASYTIASSGTWEKKTITFAGDTSGPFDNNNAVSMEVQFYLAAGSNLTSGTLQTSWGSDVAANRAVGQTNLSASTSNYWQVTGVQLEAGTVATPFEHKAYGVELAECQRYYWTIVSDGGEAVGQGDCRNTTDGQVIAWTPVTMRAEPTLVASDVSNAYRLNSAATNPTTNTVAINVTPTSKNAIGIVGTFTGLIAGQGCVIRSNNASAYVAADAEL